MKRGVCLMILACAFAMDALSFNLRTEVDPIVSGISGGNLWEFSRF